MATFGELVELTPEQQMAWNRFERALNDFKKVGGKFHTERETVHGYNGKHVSGIANDCDRSQMFRTIGPHNGHFVTFQRGAEVDED